MPKGPVEKVNDRDSRLRTRGLRPVGFWLPDTRDPAVAERIRREVLILRDHPSEAEIEPFLDAALADIEGWTA